MTPAELATLDLRRRAKKVLRRIKAEDPDVTAARRAEMEHELTQRARRTRRKRRANALRNRGTT